MRTQNVNLTPDLIAFVQKAVESGEFNNASEVHRAALAAMAREREERDLRLQRLRLEIQRGLDSGDAVPVGDLDAFLDSLAVEAQRDRRG